MSAKGKRRVLMTFMIEKEEREKAVNVVNASEFLRECVYKLNRSKEVPKAVSNLQESVIKEFEN